MSSSTSPIGRHSMTIMAATLLALLVLLFANSRVAHAQNNTTCNTSQNVTVHFDQILANIDPVTIIQFAHPPGACGTMMFVGTQTGVLYMVDVANTTGGPVSVPDGVISNYTTSVFFNISSQLIPLDPTYDERGLISAAFHPCFESNGRFFLYYTLSPIKSQTNDTCDITREDHLNTLVEFKATFVPSDGSDSGGGGSYNITQVRSILVESHPFLNHNGIQNLQFNIQDGLLYLGIGDGGLAYDPFEAAQCDDSLRGKVFRIDVDAIEAESLRTGQSVSCTTPVSMLTELQATCPVIARFLHPVVKGVRNLSGLQFVSSDDVRYSSLQQLTISEPESDDLTVVNSYGVIVAQVGQDEYESLYLATRVGTNIAWDFMEGSFCKNQSDVDLCPDVSFNCTNNVPLPDGTLPGVTVNLPIAELDHDDPVLAPEAIIGGKIFRSNVLGCQLDNAYVFADYTGKLYYITVEPLLLTVFNLTSSPTSTIPFPFTANLADICFANGTSPPAGASFLDSYRASELVVHPITIDNIDELAPAPTGSPPFNSTTAESSVFFNCMGLNPQGNVLYVGANGNTGPVTGFGAVFRVSPSGGASSSSGGSGSSSSNPPAATLGNFRSCRVL